MNLSNLSKAQLLYSYNAEETGARAILIVQKRYRVFEHRLTEEKKATVRRTGGSFLFAGSFFLAFFSAARENLRFDKNLGTRIYFPSRRGVGLHMKRLRGKNPYTYISVGNLVEIFCAAQ